MQSVRYSPKCIRASPCLAKAVKNLERAREIRKFEKGLCGIVVVM